MRTHSSHRKRTLPLTVTFSGEASLGPRPQYVGFQIPSPLAAARSARRA